MNPFTRSEVEATLERDRTNVENLRDSDWPWFTLAEGDVQILARQLAVAKELTKAARAVQWQIERACARALRANGVNTYGHSLEIDGVGTLELTVNKGTDKWDHALVAPAVAKEAASRWEVDSGVPLPEFIASELVAAQTNSTAWRVKRLKEVGLEPDRYRERGEYKGDSVALRVNVTEEAA